MKVIHLNTYAGNGGAGKACLRLHKALQQQGVDSQVAVNFLFKDDNRVHNFSEGFFNKYLTAAGILAERFVSKWVSKPLPVPFSFPFWGRNISRNEILKTADIIHLQWINHGFLRPRDLAKLAALNTPIVWTFHDSNAFTGGCHVRYSCDHFERECGNCPLLKNAGPNDWSHRIWKAKEKAYRDLDLTIVAPSKWMAASVRRSKLLADARVVVIPNTLDTEVFKPTDKTAARKTLGLDPDKFILMSGFMPSRKDMHKGTPYLVEAVDLLLEKHHVAPEKVELLVFGNRDDKNVPDFPVKTTFLGTITEEEKLAACYSAADVFIAPSLEDNLPYTVMESLACGTPVVAFTTGGIPDMVKHQQNGYLAEYKSSADLAAGINWIYRHPAREALNSNARNMLMETFSEAAIAGRYTELYQSLLNRKDV